MSQFRLQLALPRNKLRDVTLLFGGNVLKLALGFGTSVIIFRTLGPGDAGRLTLVLGVLGLLSIVAEFGLRDAAVNYIARFSVERFDQAVAIARVFFASKLILSALASTLGILAASWIAATFYPNVAVADLIRLGAFSLFADGLLAFAVVVLEAQQRFAAMSWLGVLQSILRAGLVLILFLFQQVNLVSLLVLESIIPSAVFLYALRFIPRSFYVLRFTFWEHFTLLFHFTKWIALAALASTIFLRLDVLMLSAYRAPEQVGWYAAALALVSKLDVVKGAILTTAFPDACRRSQPGDLRAYIGQSLRFTALASLAFLPLFVIDGYLIELLYGGAYRDTTLAFAPLLGAYLIGLNAEPLAYVLYPLNQPRWIAASDGIQLVFAVLVNIILIPAYGIVGAAWGVLLTRIVAAFITLILVRRFLW